MGRGQLQIWIRDIPMWLFIILYLFVGSNLTGRVVIAELTMGYDTLVPILVGAGIGFVAAFPVSWFVAKQLRGLS